MFGNKKLDHRIQLLEMEVQETNRRLIEIKQLILQGNVDTLANRVAIKKDKQPVKIIEKEVTVTRARKKPRARLRTTGGKRITEGEKAEFVKLYDQGLSFVEISGQTGRSASAISNYVFELRGTD